MTAAIDAPDVEAVFLALVELLSPHERVELARLLLDAVNEPAQLDRAQRGRPRR